MTTPKTAAKMTVKKMKLADLSLHPRNIEIYNDVTPESVTELVESISVRGILEPLRVNPKGQLVSGNRRFVAAGIAGLKEAPVIEVDFASDDDEIEALLSYNLQRKKTPLELYREGTILEQTLDRKGLKGRTNDEIAKRLGMGSGRSFERLKDIFGGGPEKIAEQVLNGELTISAGSELCRKLKKQDPKIATRAAEIFDANDISIEAAIRQAARELGETATPPKAEKPAGKVKSEHKVDQDKAYAGTKNDPQARHEGDAGSPYDDSSKVVNFPGKAAAPADDSTPADEPEGDAEPEGENEAILYFPDWKLPAGSVKLGGTKKGKDLNSIAKEWCSLVSQAATNSVIALWAPAAKLAEAMTLITDWSADFTYRTALGLDLAKTALVKDGDITETMGFILIAERGERAPGTDPLSTNLIRSQAKDPAATVPAKILDAIMQLAPSGPYLKVGGPALPEQALGEGWVDPFTVTAAELPEAGGDTPAA